MVKRRWCIYNNRYVGIEEFFTVREGMQINIPGKIEEFRKLGKNGELFCTCGCGRNLVIVAGEKMLRKQHFKVKSGQLGIKSECQVRYEGETTINSKRILKCWLDDIFRLKSEEVQLNIPISDIYDEKRRFEFTHFVFRYNFGICYERNDANLKDEKIELVAKHIGQRFLYVTDIQNKGIVGQYPEFMMKIQRVQGFCMLLNTHGSDEYINAEVKIVYYEKSFKGLWKELHIVDGKLSEFSIDEDGVLLFHKETVNKLVGEEVNSFIKEQEEKEAEDRRRKTEYEEKIKQLKSERTFFSEIEIQSKIEKDKKCGLEEIYKREKKQTKEEIKKQQLEQYYSEHPKVRILVEFIQSLERIEGIFASKQDGTYIKNQNEKINVNKATFDINRKRIVIYDDSNVKFYIYVSGNFASKNNACNTGAAYLQIDLFLYGEDEVIKEFCKRCTCTEKGKKYKVYCGADIVCPHKGEEGKICNLPSSQCSFRVRKSEI